LIATQRWMQLLMSLPTLALSSSQSDGESSMVFSVFSGAPGQAWLIL